MAASATGVPSSQQPHSTHALHDAAVQLADDMLKYMHWRATPQAQFDYAVNIMSETADILESATHIVID